MRPYKPDTLEERVASLEALVVRQEKQIKALATMMAAKASTPFDSPWERLLDGPDADLFYDPAGELACIEGCVKVFNQMWEAAGDDRAAQAAALSAFSECRRGRDPNQP